MQANPAHREDIVSLVPHSGIQFLQFPFDIDNLRSFSRVFVERTNPKERVGERARVVLYSTWNELDPEGPPSIVADGPHDRELSISKQQALEPFLGKWVPVPYLRYDKQSNSYDRGPRNWARLRIIEEPNRLPGATGATHRAIFAFDTELLPDEVTGGPTSGMSGDANRLDLAPTLNDAKGSIFHFVSAFSKLGWFIVHPSRHEDEPEPANLQGWLLAWLKELFREFKVAQARGRRPVADTLDDSLEHIARWFAMLQLIQTCITPPKIRFIDTVSETSAVPSIDVDLVLDVGNARTCGLLIENAASDPTGKNIRLTDAMVLELRDLSRPENTYSDPFESHVEFATPTFGYYRFSRLSQHRQAFMWPSLVRVGPEAQRFRRDQFGTEAFTGMSSPKRYLWDVQRMPQEWQFADQDSWADGTVPAVHTQAIGAFNANGDVIQEVRKDKHLFEKIYGAPLPRDKTEPTDNYNFSRSSIYTLMLAEIIWQAMVMCNSPEVRAGRARKDTPRRIRRIILTLPTATPTREQRIMKMRVNGAISLLWQTMGWNGNKFAGYKTPDLKTPPELVASWDEATCSQFVWLYGEIAEKMPGRIREFFELVGRPRIKTLPGQNPVGAEEPSIRIASIDIGGGTTDLMVMTYFQIDNLAIDPVQTFREGFRTAGDDIVKAALEQIVVPAITRALTSAGVANAVGMLGLHLGGDRANMTQQDKHRRRKLVLGVLRPAILKMFAACEEQAPEDAGTVDNHRIGDLLDGQSPASLDQICAHFDEAARAQGGAGFRLADVEIPFDFDALRRCIHATMTNVAECLGEVVNHFDCDMVILSGRPSRLPAVVDLFIDRLAVPPDRILPMHEYRAGFWYPFRKPADMRVQDPKTTAAVGAMLCALAEKRLPNFSLLTQNLQMRSTANFIGITTKGRLDNEKILFSHRAGGTARPALEERPVRIFGHTAIGFRQLPLERWIASPLYEITIVDAPVGKPAVSGPMMVTLERDPPTIEDDDLESRLLSEVAKEELAIAHATVESGPLQDEDFTKRVALSLRTADDKDAYWLDSGELQIEGGK